MNAEIMEHDFKLKQMDADVIEIIEIDLEQFKNASNSHNIDAFITLISGLILNVSNH